MPFSGPDPNEVQKAKELCEDLLKNVREQYEEFKARPPQRSFGNNTGYGGERGYGDRAPDRSRSYGGYNNDYKSPAPNTPNAGSPTTPADYTGAYAQSYAAGTDPYAAYGGYEAYVQYYQQYMAAMAQYQQQGAPGSAPPPPPSEAPPPPPGGSVCIVISRSISS